MKDVLEELKKFRDLESGKPIQDNKEIETFESAFQVILPSEYIEFIKIMNGVNLMGNEIVGIGGEDSIGVPLGKLYHREHSLVENPMPKYLVPFCNDGRGNHYCLNTLKNDEIKNICPVVFWQFDYSYTKEDLPEETHNSLSDWVSEIMIEWTLEDYDYNGSEK